MVQDRPLRQALPLIRIAMVGAAEPAASDTETCVFAATPMTAPSEGVGAAHEATVSFCAGTAARREHANELPLPMATAENPRNVPNQEIVICVPRGRSLKLILAAVPDTCIEPSVT